MHYDLTDLRLFLNVGEALNLTRAAEKTFLSPSAASMRIKQLEEALRTPLLIRQAKGMQLTRAGEVVLEHARAVFRQLDCLHADLLPYAQGIKGSIRLMANSTATNTFLADALSPFLREHAAIDIELTEASSEEVMASVIKGVADLGVIAARVESEELEVLPLYPDELVLIASQEAAPALPERLRLTEVLDGFSFVGLNQFNSIQTFVDRIAQARGKRVNLRIQVSSFDAVCQMVAAGAGIAVVPRACAIRYDGARRLRLVALEDPWARRQMSLIRPRSRTLPTYTEQLVRHLAQAGAALRAA
jgi:DNA-binding transcriptional LysR family regulator